MKMVDLDVRDRYVICYHCGERVHGDISLHMAGHDFDAVSNSYEICGIEAVLVKGRLRPPVGEILKNVEEN